MIFSNFFISGGIPARTYRSVRAGFAYFFLLLKCEAFMNSFENIQSMNKKSKSRPGLRAL
ncbi:MAG: hypothetical protein DRI72_03510 [Bacteroidetes bacterium]|nr:MAG: hypothetical protein DRI72_03510 [Bacteroidota bacterium]